MFPFRTEDRRENALYTTEDSRFHAGDYYSGSRNFFKMYSRNIAAEADGMAYSELNILRSLLIEPFVAVLLSVNLSVAYNSAEKQIGLIWLLNVLLPASSMIFDFLRIVSTILILLIELTIWPIRVFLGILFGLLFTVLSAGYLYALTYELFAHPGCTTRRVKVKNSVYCRIRSVPACCFGKILWFETVNYRDASKIVTVLKLQQRCGTGPECILLDGKNVFVSWWRPWTITSLIRGNGTAWNLFDIKGTKWRRTVFEMDDDQQSGTDVTSNDAELSHDGFAMRPIKFSSTYQEGILGRRQKSILYGLILFEFRGTSSLAFSIGEESCGEISSIYELEQYYQSPLGWNKCHRMIKEGNRIRVPRPDRRLMSHLLALLSSLSLYFWYKDSSHGRFGLFIDLHALLVANYAFITAYAGAILFGEYSEVVDAKSMRYGIMVTRAIDQGYVRGFHVPKGNWLMYKNGKEGSEVHSITKTEINATCNSVVLKQGNEMKIKVIGYDDQFVGELDWDGGDIP